MNLFQIEHVLISTIGLYTLFTEPTLRATVKGTSISIQVESFCKRPKQILFFFQSIELSYLIEMKVPSTMMETLKAMTIEGIPGTTELHIYSITTCQGQPEFANGIIRNATVDYSKGGNKAK